MLRNGLKSARFLGSMFKEGGEGGLSDLLFQQS